MGSRHGPLFAPPLCTLLLTDSDKESELKKKKRKKRFVCRSGPDGFWPRGQHHNESNVSVYRFPRQNEKENARFVPSLPPFPLVVFNFLSTWLIYSPKERQRILWSNNVWQAAWWEIAIFSPLIPLICTNSIIQHVWVFLCAFFFTNSFFSFVLLSSR